MARRTLCSVSICNFFHCLLFFLCVPNEKELTFAILFFRVIIENDEMKRGKRITRSVWLATHLLAFFAIALARSELHSLHNRMQFRYIKCLSSFHELRKPNVSFGESGTDDELTSGISIILLYIKKHSSGTHTHCTQKLLLLPRARTRSLTHFKLGPNVYTLIICWSNHFTMKSETSCTHIQRETEKEKERKRNRQAWPTKCKRYRRLLNLSSPFWI